MNTEELQKTIKKERIGPFVSKILRHAPEFIGITIDSNGWANVQELIEGSLKKNRRMSREILDIIVETNDKKRLEYNEEGTKIRAKQGHSIPVDVDLELKTPPDFLYHGTAQSSVSSILTSGLDKRNRNHVHLSESKETAIKVGARHGKPVILKVDAQRMNQDGIEFYLSSNGVWLTEYIDPSYLTIWQKNHHILYGDFFYVNLNGSSHLDHTVYNRILTSV